LDLFSQPNLILGHVLRAQDLILSVQCKTKTKMVKSGIFKSHQ